MTTYQFRLNAEQVDLIRAILVEFDDCNTCQPSIQFNVGEYYKTDIPTLVREIRNAIQEARLTQ
jgi:hypothetical protein